MFRLAVILVIGTSHVLGERLPDSGDRVGEASQDPVFIYAAEGDPSRRQQINRRSIPPYDPSAFSLGNFAGSPTASLAGTSLGYGLGSGFAGSSLGFMGLNNYGLSGMGASRFGLMGSNFDTMNPMYRSNSLFNPGFLNGNSLLSTGNTWNNPATLGSLNWSQLSNPLLLNSNLGNLDASTLQLLANNPSYYGRTAFGNQNLYTNGLTSNDLSLLLMNRNVLSNGLATQQFNPLTLPQSTTTLKRSPAQDPQSPYYTRIANAEEKEETTNRNQKRNLRN